MEETACNSLPKGTKRYDFLLKPTSRYGCFKKKLMYQVVVTQCNPKKPKLCSFILQVTLRRKLYFKVALRRKTHFQAALRRKLYFELALRWELHFQVTVRRKSHFKVKINLKLQYPPRWSLKMRLSSRSNV